MAWTLILGIPTAIDFSKRNRFDEIGSPAIKTPVIKILMGKHWRLPRTLSLKCVTKKRNKASIIFCCSKYFVRK